MGSCLKQGNKMNVNGFCVKQGQGLKNNHSNFPPIAPPASSPGTHIFPKRTPSTAPTGVLIEAGFPIDFFGIREVPYEAQDQGIRTSPGIHISPRRTPGVQLPTGVLLGVPKRFFRIRDVPYEARDSGFSSKTGAGFGIESIHARWYS